MKLTIKSGDFENSMTLDQKYTKSSYKGRRAFGITLLQGIASLEKLGYYVNFYFDEKNVRYDRPCFIIKNFLAPSLRAYKLKKKCPCGNTILCLCHEVCEECGADCELAQKAVKVTVDIMADRVLSCIVAFNARYNDPGEQQTMKDHGQ